MKFSRFLLAAAFAALAVSAPASAQLKREAQAVRNFGMELDEASRAPDFVGLAVAVVKDGRIALTKTYGMREAGGTDPVTPDTAFRLASLSKGFASTLAVLEMKDGKFALEDKISAVVPQFQLRTAADTQKVTVEDILAQRVGLPPYAYDNLLEEGREPLEILARYKDVKLTCPPGQCYGYQNSTYNMIANVIETTTGRGFAQEMRDRIFDPLGMKTASLGMSGLKANDNWARPHMRRNNVWQAVPVKEAYYKLPAAGGMNASITDLSLWLIAQMGGRPDVLSDDVLATLRAPRVTTPAETQRQRVLKTPVKTTHYGLGWRTYDYAGQTLVTHSGSVEGYFAQIAYLPERHTGIVILSNTRGARAGKILPTWLDYELRLEKTDWLRLGEIAEAEAAVAAGVGAPAE